MQTGSPINRHSCGRIHPGYCKRIRQHPILSSGRCGVNAFHHRQSQIENVCTHSSIDSSRKGRNDDQIDPDHSSDNDADVPSISKGNSVEVDATDTTAVQSNINSHVPQNATPTAKQTTTKKSSSQSSKWQANNFESDHQLLKTAMARQSAMTNLRQQQRKYTLDYGFARNRRPLLQDLLRYTITIGLWMIFSICGGAGAGRNGIDTVVQTWKQHQSWRYKMHVLVIQSIVTMTTLHHWIVGVTLPLVLLALSKREQIGPQGRTLEEYFTSKSQSLLDDAPSFFYTSPLPKQKAKAKAKDTGNFALCLLENWSSAVIMSFVCGLYPMIASLRKKQSIWNVGFISGSICSTDVWIRLLTRLGAAVALHQFPSLLFELRRNDQPRPLCRLTTYMQQCVKTLLRWLPLGVATDLAILFNNRKGVFSSTLGVGTATTAFLSMFAPVCHLIALGRITRLSKCSAFSLSESTSFPTEYDDTTEQDSALLEEQQRQQVKWRYQLRWRTPQRLGETLRSWANYFLTGHVPLLFELDYWKKQPIEFDDFSTEGTHFLINKDRKQQLGKEYSTINSESENDDLIPHSEAISESLSLIFRDRDAAICNATQARLLKHQESYDTKTLDDVLGVAVQQTFGIGISYDFDHFDSPEDGKEVSIHQLRARMAKSAVRRKRELDAAMKKELDLLRRLKDNVVTATNKDEATKEMKSVEQGIRERHDKEVNHIKDALMILIPTNADAPKGTEQYENPIMVAEYVDLKAPFQGRGEITATVESGPDTLSVVEDYVRRDYGDEAADAFRRDEVAARRKEKEMLSSFRQRHGEMKDEEKSSIESLSDGNSDTSSSTT